MPVAWLALGSNLQRPAHQLRRAVTALERIPGCRVIQHSSVYRTPPVGPGAQAYYLNAVVGVHCTLAPLHLLHHTQAIERSQGRKRRRRWGPRTLDIDILSYGPRPFRHPRLVIPHPRLDQRAFVLLPFAEVAPELVLPCGATVSELTARKHIRASAENITLTNLRLRG